MIPSRKLSDKESLDVRSMRYFIPKNNLPKGWRITKADRVMMADLSSRGIRPRKVTPGMELLKWGKTFREEQITRWREDVIEGLTTKYEILSSLPLWLRPSIEKSLQGAMLGDPFGDYDAEDTWHFQGYTHPSAVETMHNRYRKFIEETGWTLKLK